MKKIYRGFILFISLAVILSICSSFLFLAIESDHECVGEGCSVCCQIEAAESLIRQGTVTMAAAVVFLFVCENVAVLIGTVKVGAFLTPVILKTKLSY